mgnify:CR=1 FL=1
MHVQVRPQLSVRDSACGLQNHFMTIYRSDFEEIISTYYHPHFSCFPHDTVLKCNFADLGDQGVADVCFFLINGQNQVLRSLELMYNNIGPAGASKVAELLESNVKLETLGLEGPSCPSPFQLCPGWTKSDYVSLLHIPRRSWLQCHRRCGGNCDCQSTSVEFVTDLSFVAGQSYQSLRFSPKNLFCTGTGCIGRQNLLRSATIRPQRVMITVLRAQECGHSVTR